MDNQRERSSGKLTSYDTDSTLLVGRSFEGDKKVGFNHKSIESSTKNKNDINVYSLLSFQPPPNFVEFLNIYLIHMMEDLENWDENDHVILEGGKKDGRNNVGSIFAEKKKKVIIYDQ